MTLEMCGHISGASGGEKRGGGAARGADAPPSPPNIKCPFWNAQCLFYPLFHFKTITLLKVFYNFTKVLHSFI